jgi:hypothetical protein
MILAVFLFAGVVIGGCLSYLLTDYKYLLIPKSHIGPKIWEEVREGRGDFILSFQPRVAQTKGKTKLSVVKDKT